MSQAKLTKSQEQAIDQQKRIARMVYGQSVDFTIWQPKHTNITRLICVYQGKNMLGEKVERSTSWIIGKRGKVTND